MKKYILSLALVLSANLNASVLEWEELGPFNLGGYVHEVLIDVNDSNVLYSIGLGGLWRSEDAGAYWSQYAFYENFSTLSMGNITQASDGTLYVSTGQPRHGSQSGQLGGFIPGEGIYKIQNWMTPPEHLIQTMEWSVINDLKVDPADPNKVYALLDTYQGGGLFRSSDAGLNWEPIAGLTGQIAYNIEFSLDGDIYAGVGGKLYKSSDSGETFSQLTDVLLPQTSPQRRTVKTAPSDNNIVYCVMSSGGGVIRIAKSEDAGATWSELPIGMDEFITLSSLAFEAWFTLTLAVDPLDPNRIIVGSRELISYSDTDGFIHLDNTSTTDFNNPTFLPYHKLDVIFDNQNPDRLYISTPNGVYRSTNAQETAINFEERSNNLRMMAISGFDSNMDGDIIASQDLGPGVNFSCEMDAYSAELIPDIFDRSRINSSHINSDYSFTMPFYGGIPERSYNNLQSFQSFVNTSTIIDPTFSVHEYWENTCLYTNAEDSIMTSSSIADPIAVLDRIKRTRSLFGITFNMYSSDATSENNANDIDPIELVELIDICPTCPNFNVSSMAIDTHGEDILVGGEGGQLRKITITSNTVDYPTSAQMIDDGSGGSVLQSLEEYILGQGTVSATGLEAEPFSYEDYSIVDADPLGGASAPWGTSHITSINFDPTDSDRAILSIGTYSLATDKVYYTEDATASVQNWIPLAGLPSGMPVYDVLLSANDYAGDKYAFAATERGIWSYNFTTSEWTEENSGIGSLRVFELRQELLNSCGCYALYVGTHGRGMFRSTNLMPSFCNTDLGCDVISSVPDIESTNISSSLTLYPNPVSDILYVSIDSQVRHSIKMEIYDLSGRLLISNSTLSSSNMIELETKILENGHYILSVDNGETIRSEKFIVLR